MLTTVVLDVGETLVDETPMWTDWADWLGVPAFTLFGVLGGLAATGRDHREVVPLLRPGRTFAQERADREAAGRADPDLLLYPDAVPCLAALREDGWRVVVGGNQPAAFQSLVERLGLPVDLVTSSAAVGHEKPAPAFFAAVAALAGAAPEECVSVGDRVDNDVVGARAAGMTAVHLRRGPWGVLHADDPALDDPGVHRITGLDELAPLLRRLRG